MAVTNNDDIILDEYGPTSSEDFDYTDDHRTDEEKADDEAVSNERHMMRTAGTKLTDELIEWFELQASQTDSVDVTLAYAADNGVQIDDALRAFNIVHKLLQEKKEELIVLKEEHLS